MPTATEFAKPVRVVLFRHASQSCWGARVARDLELALFGDPDKDRAERWEPLDLAAAIPLDEELEFRRFTAPPTAPADAGRYLDEALHTVVVVLVDRDLMADGAFLDWLEACAAQAGMTDKRHQLFVRSEEHTSELQSRQYLVCR